MKKQTTMKFVCNGKILMRRKIEGFKDGEVDFIKRHLATKHQVPEEWIDIQFD